MLTVRLFKEALKEDFDYTTRQKGQSLFDSNSTLSITISNDDIEATVLDQGRSFYITFEYIEDEYYVSLEGYCTCERETCEHQAAVLYAAIKLKNSPSVKSKNKNSQPKSTPSKQAPLSQQLEGEHAGEYRHLPLQKSLLNTLKQFRPKRFQTLTWNESFQGTFINPQELEIENIYTHNHYFNTNKKTIRLKIEDNGTVHIKCLTCKDKKKTLCAHQMALLQGAAQALEILNIQDPKCYHNILTDAAQQLKMSPKIMEKYFEVKLMPDGPAVIGKKENMVNHKWIELTQNIQLSTRQERKEIVKNQTQLLEEGRDTLYGFVWAELSDYHYNDVEKEFPIYFTKGMSYKNKPGIRDANKNIASLPKGFPQPQQQLAQQLFFLSQEKNPVQRFEKIKELIENNLDILHEIYQYTIDDTVSSRAPRVSDLNIISFESQPLECNITFEIIDGLTHLTRHISHNGEPFNFKKIIYSNEVFCSTNTHAYLFPHHKFQEFMDIFPPDHNTIILPTMDKIQHTRLINQFKSNFDVIAPDELMVEEVILENPQFQILLREAGEFIIFEPRLKYGEISFNAFDDESYVIEEQLQRVAEEDRMYLIDFLKKSHPEFDNPIQIQDYVFLPVKEMINNYWFVHFNEACDAAGIEILGQKDLTKFKYSKFRAKTHMHIKSGIDWFDVDAGVSFGKETVRMSDWIRALRNKESFITLKDGSLGILPEEWLQQAAKILAVADVEKGELKISKYRFNVIEDLFENIDDKKIVKELKEKKARLLQIDTNKKYPLPKNVKAKLRDYQKHGFEWLKFLDESGFGGILADDMGLGKTLQVITLLADQIKAEPSLVIVPRSLLFNWGSELEKFCPDLKYIIHHGPSRARQLEKIITNNIIITTYSTAALDIQMFKDFKFNYIILDESQAIKNPNSKRYKAMRLLQSNNRLAMTGTPIENNTFDLFAQLSFTSPGLLGSMTSFKNNFSIPIDSQNDAEAATLLRKLIHPFILRRTKAQVAKDLPEKTETIIYCEMDTAQRKLYDNLKKQIKEDIETTIEEKGVNKSKFQMLDGLLRLRQMCNSPLLINKSFTGANANSVKINTLLENLTEALDQKHNALVFSQFTSLLAIIREELDKRGIPYAYLDGSTTKRQAQVDKFMKNDDIRIFLISIKAGNTGMNLTKADYVYIIDPWWNPAVEAQAIDRTHRIGQKNQIFAYKLICKNSIEEKILKLQAKKKKLAEDIIQTDENILKSLKKEELMALFD